MNERIKQLLLQAGFTNAYTDPKEGFELVFVDEEHTTESVTKFAELIVRECANAADMYEGQSDYVGDCVAEYMGYGEAEGVAEWRAK